MHRSPTNRGRSGRRTPADRRSPREQHRHRPAPVTAAGWWASSASPTRRSASPTPVGGCGMSWRLPAVRCGVRCGRRLRRRRRRGAAARWPPRRPAGAHRSEAPAHLFDRRDHRSADHRSDDPHPPGPCRSWFPRSTVDCAAPPAAHRRCSSTDLDVVPVPGVEPGRVRRDLAPLALMCLSGL